MTGSRKGKMQIGGHFDPRDVFTLQEVLARESRERGERKTMQEALDENGARLLRQARRETAERRRRREVMALDRA
jgi:hypothetical protein